MPEHRVRRIAAGAALGAAGVALLFLSAANLHAQPREKLSIEVRRPDAETERRDARLLPGSSPPPSEESVRVCGNLEIALRKVSYDRSLGYFNYRLLVRRSGQTEWKEWLFGRPDVGRFESQLLETVKVYATDEQTPDCVNFQLPIYCIAGCSGDSWWTLAENGPKTWVVYLGGSRLLDLLFTKKISLPGKISNLSLTVNPGSAWDTSVVLGSQRPNESNLQLELSPKWSRLQNLLFSQDGFVARLTYDAEVSDAVTEGITIPGAVVLPVLVKPAPWLLIFPLMVGTTAALVVRQLAWKNVKNFWRELLLVTMVAGIVLFVTFLMGAKVSIAIGQVSADGLGGATLIGLTTGFAGRKALDRLYKMLGIASDK
jgi:hypothetical protein